MATRNRKVKSVKTELLTKSREAMLSAVQIFNNPNPGQIMPGYEKPFNECLYSNNVDDLESLNLNSIIKTIYSNSLYDICIYGDSEDFDYICELDIEMAKFMIDEYPILSIAAAFAKGKSIFRGLKELKVKESDRLELIRLNLVNCGCDCEVVNDDLIIRCKKIYFIIKKY